MVYCKFDGIVCFSKEGVVILPDGELEPFKDYTNPVGLEEL